MDAADDREVKLQRASGDLVEEFQAKLPSLLWKPQSNPKVPRRWTLASKTERLVNLLEPFQEWPQLLDPHLQSLLPPLVDALLAYLLTHRDQYATKSANQPAKSLYPLPRAICRLLYTFCKVRGAKVISRFLNNEPKYLDPFLRAFIEWDAVESDNASEDIPRRMVWEERYVLLIWLSHLLLAPFDLSSMSSSDIPVSYQQKGTINLLLDETPVVAKSLLSVALAYVHVAGKEREAATMLLARLASRRDMQALGILRSLTEWAFNIIHPPAGTEPSTVYAYIGVLSFLARMAGSGQAEDFAPLILPVFKQTMRLVQDDTEVSRVILSSAVARKTIIKILRSLTVMGLSLNERSNSLMSDDQISYILEETIDHLLTALADKDTPVRFAASKALSIITLKLDQDMARDVIEAVTGSLEENILFEKRDGKIITPSEARQIGSSTLKRNLSAVDAQRWQGLILTLGHLLFRHAPPTNQLPNVLQPLVSGLDFEQRSYTGSSVGTGVRDAACFGIWAISRKYTTLELLAINRRNIYSSTAQDEVSILQLLAIELVCAACVDPSGNIRRGASAALQELIGRHPNTIVEGISIVQVVDYHAVARRSRAMIDVAKATVDLSPQYWNPLVESLMQWRGIGSADSESRRQAAKALGVLSTQEGSKSVQIVLQKLLSKLYSIPRSDIETRHGCLLAISSVVDAFNSLDESNLNRDENDAFGVAGLISKVWEIFGSSVGPSKDDLTLQTFRPELTAEASSRLISSLSQSSQSSPDLQVSAPSSILLDEACKTLMLCLSRNDEISIEASSSAISQLWSLISPSKQAEIMQEWFSHIRATRNLPTARGHISVLGFIFAKLHPADTARQTVTEELIRCAEKEELIEKRVVAVKSFSSGVLPHLDIDVTESIADSLIGFLNDYTTDRRGDIGSLIRLEGIQAAKVVLQKTSDTTQLHVQNIVGCLCRLAAEKLDKIRFEAWLCLQSFWETASDFPPLLRRYEHFSQVSTCEYFVQLMDLQTIDWLRRPLLQGLATSVVAGAEGLIRSTRSALIQSVNRHPDEKHAEIGTAIIQDLLLVLKDKLQDDRYAIPILETIAFLLDSYVASNPGFQSPDLKKAFVLVQKAHFKTTNIARLEAATRVYAPLSRFEQVRVEVLKKLTGMLLHPFPRVRTTTAEYLFMETGLELVKLEDWADQPTKLKGKVEEVRNLEERIKPDELKEALSEIFSEYGTILEIIAKRNLKAKGQAFIVFDNVDSATRAIDEINGFDLFDKPMVLDYAKTRSDATVLKDGGEEEFEAHKRRRLAEKERRQAHEALEAQKKLKRPPVGAPDAPGRPIKTAKGAGLKPTSGAATAVIPDEYLPPNKILFLRDLPDAVDQDSLTSVFGRFEGFREVRLVPGRKGIAFVEYETESGAISAKEATSGMPMGPEGKPIRVTYQRQ
ncbi:tubulin folding cofactor D C terminal-domain-containing protein [Aspergillus unguis]